MFWTHPDYNWVYPENQAKKLDLSSFVVIPKKQGVLFVFYDRFAELCKARGMSPAAVTRDLGLNNSSPTAWKRGAIPKGKTLQKLADYFGVSVDYLLVDTWGIKAGGKIKAGGGIKSRYGIEAGGGIETGGPVEVGPSVFDGFGYEEPMLDKRGKSETFRPWTKIDQELFDLGGFEALVKFEFLSKEDKDEALKDISKFVEFTLSKYKQRKRTETTPQSPSAPQEGTDTTSPPADAPEGK